VSEPDAEFCVLAILAPRLALTMVSEPEPPWMAIDRCTALPRTTIMDGPDVRWGRCALVASLTFTLAVALTAFAGVDVTKGASARMPIAAIALSWAVRLNIVISRLMRLRYTLVGSADAPVHGAASRRGACSSASSAQPAGLDRW